MKRLNYFAATSALLVASVSQSSLAAFSAASADFILTDVNTTGTADILFSGFDTFYAEAVSPGSLISGDGLFESSSFTDTDKEAFALNESPAPGEYAATAGAFASDTHVAGAISVIEAEMQVFGVGTIELVFDYSLFVETFDTTPTDSAYAAVTVEVISLFGDAFESFGAEVFGSPFGDSGAITDVFTLVFDVNAGENPADSYYEFLTITTEASAGSTAATVPVPAAAWLFFTALAGLPIARKLR